MAGGGVDIALLFRGNREARDTLTLPQTRLSKIGDALAAEGLKPVAAVYSDDFADEIREQLLSVDMVLVWVDPFTPDGDRSVLDPLLREVAGQGVLVSSHPDIILKMGTKEVLYDTRDMPWGSDVRIYHTLDELRRNLPDALLGGARVLKQYRGNGGNGVFRVELAERVGSIGPDTPLRMRHARRGSVEQSIDFYSLVEKMARNFEGGMLMIDQEWQPRMTEGVIRCYFIRDRVQGFGEQLVNAFYPASTEGEPVQPGPRLYYPPDREDLQSLKRAIETKWVPQMQECVGVDDASLPVLWDADLFRGQKDEHGEDTWVLCEINISAVLPFPDECLAPLARETRRRLSSR